MKYGNVTGKIFADAFAVCRARMRKTAKKLPAPSRMYRGGRESRAGKPRQSPPPAEQPAKARRRAGKPHQSSPPCGEAPPKPAAARGNPPKPAAGRGSPAKSRRRAGRPAKARRRAGNPPKTAAVRGNPPKRPLAANRAEYKKSGGSYDPPFAWFIFVSLLKTNISLALVI